jgi:glyoxylase-like metal-dependent hydrolase (beta-lactamase superfamily II)
LLTHCHYDHTGGAGAVKRYYGCQIVAHETDAVYLEKGDSIVTAACWYGAQMPALKVDRKITATRDTIEIGNGILRSYHCPGHSPGSLVYLTEVSSTRVLFGQDIHGPLHPSFLSDRRDYLNSLSFILSLDIDILCEGHFGVFRGRQEIAAFIRSYLA